MDSDRVPQGECPEGDQPDAGISEKAKLEEELAQVEDDIHTLKATLSAKIRRANELKKRLGYPAIATLPYDFMEGVHKIGDSEAYVKTSEFLNKAKDKTVTVAQDAKEKVESTFHAIKNSDTMKTISDKVGSTFNTVKDAFILSTYGHPPDD